MATLPFDNMTLQSLMQSLPELQKKKRRAEELRRTQEQFKEMGARSAGGLMLPTQRGGLYETVARYRPDYAGMASQGVGALGDWMTGRQAETAQGEYDTAQAQAILGGAQQLTKPSAMGAPGAAPAPEAAAPEEPMPTQQTIRAFLGMAGGPDIKDFLPKDPSELKARDTEIDQEGNIWTQMSNGEWRNSGIKARAGMKPIVDANGNVYHVPTTTQGAASQVQLGGAQAPSAPSAPSPAQVPPLDRAALHERQRAQESAGDPNAVSSAGARGLMQLMPATARTLEQKFGYPPGSADTDPKVNEELGRRHMDDLLAKYDGNQADALVAYNRGEPNADAWIAAGRDPASLPEETHGYLQKILGADPYAAAGATGASVPPAGPVSGARPLRVTGARETKLLEEQGKAQAEAQAQLGKVEGAAESGTRAIDDLLSDSEGLKSIVGKKDTLLDWGAIPDALAQYAIPALASGEKEANAFAKWQTVKSGAFLQAFEELRGGGQITEAEGTKAERAKAALDRAQSYEEVKRQLGILREVIGTGLRRARARAKGDFSGDNALSATMLPGMTSPSVAPALQPPPEEEDPELADALRQWGG